MRRLPALTPAIALAAATSTTFAATPAHAVTTEPDGAFRDPATYDLSIAHITDTQYLTQCANGAGILPTMMKRCQAIYEGMNRWIVDNAAHRKVAYTAHTGDLIDSYWGATPNLAKGEFGWASKA